MAVITMLFLSLKMVAVTMPLSWISPWSKTNHTLSICSRFAQLAAGIFLNRNFRIYLFSGHTPTPYTVRVDTHVALHVFMVTGAFSPTLSRSSSVCVGSRSRPLTTQRSTMGTKCTGIMEHRYVYVCVLVVCAVEPL